MPFALTACATQTAAPDVLQSQMPDATPAPAFGNEVAKIGVIADVQNPMQEAFVQSLQTLCESNGYGILVQHTDTPDAQLAAANTLMQAGANIIVVDPVDIDEMERVLEVCAGAYLINIEKPITGHVDVLFAPNYLEMGRACATEVNQLLDQTQSTNVLVLAGGIDDFIMQMIEDGFLENLTTRAKVEQVFCDFEEQKAYTATKEALNTQAFDAIFTHNAAMANGALRALSEADASVPIVTVECPAQLAGEVKNGNVAAAVYFDPAQIARKVVGCVKSQLNGQDTQVFDELLIYTVTAQNIDRAIRTGESYAGAI